MSATKIPCTEPGCDKSFRNRADISRHMWYHIPRTFRPLCPGTRKGPNGENDPCIYRYSGRRDLWKSHWAQNHRNDAYPSSHRFDTLRECHVKYAKSLPAPRPVATATRPINVDTAGIPALNTTGNYFHPSLALHTPGFAGIQTQIPFVGHFGPAAADMFTHFHPSVNAPWHTFYSQPGPSMVAIPQGFPQPTPIVDHPQGSVPWLTGLEDMQEPWQEIPDGLLDTHSQQLFF